VDTRHFRSSILPGSSEDVPSGPGAAAILAAGVGALALGVFACAGDGFPAVRKAFNLWPASGPLSGVSTAAVVVWLLTWLGLGAWWERRDVNLARINFLAFTMLLAGMLLAFPPFMDLLLGK
jgi:hypothetical protein